MTARLRQVVLAAREPEPTVAALRGALPLGEPYHDPGVRHFGLVNAVMALGDTFIEVVTPVEKDAPAQRFIERRGEGGYMVLIQVEDTGAARERAAANGFRIVWQNDLDEISGTHLHPKDVPGAIVSVDTPRPPESWHWAGPEWSARVPVRVGSGQVVGATIAAPDPEDAVRRWATAVGVERTKHNRGQGGYRDWIELDGGEISFVSGVEPAVASFELSVPGLGGRLEIAGTTFVFRD